MKKNLIATTLATALLAIIPTSVQSAPRNEIRQELPRSVAADIAAAGQLRMQSQRLAKLWLQAGLGINAGAASSQLGRGVGQFEAALADLSRNARDPKLQRPLQRAAELWSNYRQALAAPYSAENMKRVNYLADDLMLATGKLTMLIESEADSPSGRLLDLSLRQNMLAQRLARLYLMAQTGDRSRGRLVDMEQARKEFSVALTELAVAPENTPASREALELARTQWLFFDTAVGELSRGADSRPQHVATTSERIQEVLEAVSQQYARDYSSARMMAATTADARRN